MYNGESEKQTSCLWCRSFLRSLRAHSLTPSSTPSHRPVLLSSWMSAGKSLEAVWMYITVLQCRIVGRHPARVHLNHLYPREECEVSTQGRSSGASLMITERTLLVRESGYWCRSTLTPTVLVRRPMGLIVQYCNSRSLTCRYRSPAVSRSCHTMIMVYRKYGRTHVHGFQ